MSKLTIENSTLTAIADAIRGKNGTSEKIQVSELASAIANLPTGGCDLHIKETQLSSNKKIVPKDELLEAASFVFIIGKDKVNIVNFKELKIYAILSYQNGYEKYTDILDSRYSLKKKSNGYSLVYADEVMGATEFDWSNSSWVQEVYFS